MVTGEKPNVVGMLDTSQARTVLVAESLREPARPA
jgi:hypothetical protein